MKSNRLLSSVDDFTDLLSKLENAKKFMIMLTTKDIGILVKKIREDTIGFKYAKLEILKTIIFSFFRTEDKANIQKINDSIPNERSRNKIRDKIFPSDNVLYNKPPNKIINANYYRIHDLDMIMVKCFFNDKDAHFIKNTLVFLYYTNVKTDFEIKNLSSNDYYRIIHNYPRNGMAELMLTIMFLRIATILGIKPKDYTDLYQIQSDNAKINS